MNDAQAEIKKTAHVGRWSNLEHFDLAGGRVQVLCVLSTLVLFKRVDLDAEGNAFLPSVLTHGEFCADAVNLKKRKKGYKSMIYMGTMTRTYITQIYMCSFVLVISACRIKLTLLNVLPNRTAKC